MGSGTRCAGSAKIAIRIAPGFCSSSASRPRAKKRIGSIASRPSISTGGACTSIRASRRHPVIRARRPSARGCNRRSRRRRTSAPRSVGRCIGAHLGRHRRRRVRGHRQPRRGRRETARGVRQPQRRSSDAAAAVRQHGFATRALQHATLRRAGAAADSRSVRRRLGRSLVAEAARASRVPRAVA